jgi:exoribonuclease R
VVKKGDLVEFKPGLFGVEIPKNYGIFLRSYKKKSSKVRIIELFTLKGKQETKQSNLFKKTFGESIQLQGSTLPQGKELTKQVNAKAAKLDKLDKTMGELNERELWKKLVNAKLFDLDKSYSVQELAFVWYGIEIEELSKNRIKKVRDCLGSSRVYGQGYFDTVTGNPSLWTPITKDQQSAIGKDISHLGSIRNKMFEIIEVPVEDADDPEETEMIRAPIAWNKIAFTEDDTTLFEKILQLMAHFVEYDSWPATGMGGTHIFALDGFSLRSFTSYLAEDWVNEGRSSFADTFVKLLIRVGFWDDTEALQIISKRLVTLAPHFEWITDPRMEKIAAKFKEPEETPEVFKKRLDLRHLEFYTIDPPTAKDFDDAVALEKLEDEYILWVAIADVSHYVEKDSSLDLHARNRATSVYLPTKTLPMLPTHLSDNLCSLNAQKPRLAMVVEIHYTKKGKRLLKQCRVHNSVIRVKENLSYDFVDEAIIRKEEPFSELHEFALLLQQFRKGLNLETDDVRLELGGKMAVTTKQSSNATKLIETFMVAANETVAEILLEKELPVVFRNHPLPDQENVLRFNGQSKVIGLNYEIELPKFTEDVEKEESIMDILSGKQGSGLGGSRIIKKGGGSDFAEQLKEKMGLEDEGDESTDLGTPMVRGLAQLNDEQQEAILTPFRTVIASIENLEDKDLQKLAYLIVLRVLSRAIYSAGNFGHFGLGSSAYLHFTSPIRRYPDIVAHRVCKAMIAGEDLVYSADEIDETALHCTEQSEIAEKLERTVIGAGFSFLTRNPEYTENRQGMVASIARGGVYILLPNGIEARIPLSQITSRATFVDEFESMCFVGFQSIDDIAEEVTPDNWRELLEGGDEPVEIITKLGEKIAIQFNSWNHIEGRVGAVPISIEEAE